MKDARASLPRCRNILKAKIFHLASTTWACLWLADIEQLEYFVNISVEDIGPNIIRASLVPGGNNVIAKCMYSQDQPCFSYI